MRAALEGSGGEALIRSIWTWINGALATLVCATPVVVAGLLRLRPTDMGEIAARTWSRWILRASGVRVQVEGAEHVRAPRAQIIVSNHQSWYDVFALAHALPKRFHFVAKRELERIPIFGAAWKAAGHISIDRTDRQSAIRSLEQAGAQLRREGSAVVIFAEGTRSPDGRLLPFKKGAFMLALTSGVEIVPAAVSGSRTILPKGGWRVRPGTITVRFGEPVPVQAGGGPADALIEEIRRRVNGLRDPRDEPRSLREPS